MNAKTFTIEIDDSQLQLINLALQTLEPSFLARYLRLTKKQMPAILDEVATLVGMTANSADNPLSTDGINSFVL
jgi:hypothetical protein